MPSIFHAPGKPRISANLGKDDVLWRYVDAAKFFDFLENSTLFFCRGDKFEDKFEGAFTSTLRQKIIESYKTNKIDFTYEEFKQELRQRVFVNCWHRSRDDSAAMWALYGKSECSVALTTTVGRLANALEEQRLSHDLALERVEYIKHWRDPELDITPYARVFAYKTKAYEHEKEMRVLLDRSLGGFDTEVKDVGIAIKVNPATLLRSIVIAPEAPAWFDALVKKAAKRYGLVVDIRNSKLSGDPI